MVKEKEIYGKSYKNKIIKSRLIIFQGLVKRPKGL